MELSDVQKEIIATPGNLIVQASAGTGKTHTMVEKISKEIEDNCTHKAIAAITFTIKAAKEIKDRLRMDTSKHFIGTNNSFVIEEVIKPFMKDVFGLEYDLDMDTDYSYKIGSFREGIDTIRDKNILTSYSDSKKNFIFELAKLIIKKSEACRLYLKAKYFKIYIDEYQDCDEYMHEFFMYLCDDLEIDTFIVGDEKQSIYMWRGAHPESFKSILEKENFSKIPLRDNFRSCKQIQNYSNLLCNETRSLYQPTEKLDNIVWIFTDYDNWVDNVLQNIDTDKKFALLRFSNNNAKEGANSLKEKGFDCEYIPQIPIAEITTESAWLYSSIAKYVVLDDYSVYDFISEIPSENFNKDRDMVSTIKKFLESIKSFESKKDFQNSVNDLAFYLGYKTKLEHLLKLYNTISDPAYYVAFEPEKYQHVSITFHSSKGLEFEQVVVFAEDYNLSTINGIYNHYVAVTRAENKLIIVRCNCYHAKKFQKDLAELFGESNLRIPDLVSLP